LTGPEIRRILDCGVKLGIRKVRLTGGEPLLRSDLEEVIGAAAGNGGITDLCMTTNAQGLAPRAGALKKAGLRRINVSLDSLKPDRFREMTGGGDLSQVLEGIHAAMEAGLSPVKINCVVIRGKNDGESGDFISLARRYPVQVRFIELMPLGGGDTGVFRVPMEELLTKHPELRPLGKTAGQPALDYTGEGFRGTLGFISAVTRPFCNDCNRIRITPDGKLRPCLGDNRETDLREALLRDDETLLRLMEETVFHKPRGHRFNEGFVSERRMNRIGG
jgi:cyclic pyranopterin phosphate synthase